MPFREIRRFVVAIYGIIRELSRLRKLKLLWDRYRAVIFTRFGQPLRMEVGGGKSFENFNQAIGLRTMAVKNSGAAMTHSSNSLSVPLSAGTN
jgi:hypothetical protein